MIELSAVLGAMIMTLCVFQMTGEMEEPWLWIPLTFVAAPVFGALWGTVIGAGIHFIATGAGL